MLALGAFQLAVNKAIAPPTGRGVAAAQRAYEQDRQEWVENHEQYEQECQDAGEPPENCVYEEPTLDDYTGTPAFDEIASISLQVSVYLVALAAFMVAGSFIGAEYSTGSIANWLSFIPRRGTGVRLQADHRGRPQRPGQRGLRCLDDRHRPCCWRAGTTCRW